MKHDSAKFRKHRKRTGQELFVRLIGLQLVVFTLLQFGSVQLQLTRCTRRQSQWFTVTFRAITRTLNVISVDVIECVCRQQQAVAPENKLQLQQTYYIGY